MSQDSFNYKGWLNSDKFLKRALAIYGYLFVAGLIISIPLYVIFFSIAFIVSSNVQNVSVNHINNWTLPVAEIEAPTTKEKRGGLRSRWRN